VRVLLVCHGYPPLGVAGVERVSAQTAERLTARGHDVTVLTRRPSEAPATLTLERDRRNGVPVVSIAGGGSTFGRFPGHEAALEQAFERVLLELDPELVLITHLLHHSPGYVNVAHRWGVPVVLELHDFFALCPRAHLQRVSGELCGGPEGGRACAVHCFADQRDAAARWSLRAHSFAQAVHDADAVLCPSRYVADRLAPLRGDAAPIAVLGNGVGPFGPVLRDPARDASEPLRLASIGVTVEHKGFHVVVEALRRARLPAARYTIFGLTAEPGASELRRAAKRVPGLELRLFGGFEPHMLPVLLADVDAVVIPSLVAETYSIVAREALVCGVPILASRIGALPDAVREGENGRLFEPGDASGLALLLQDLAADRAALRRLAAGIRDDDALPVQARADALKTLLRDVVARGPRGAREPAGDLTLVREALATRPARP
jgi:glycosyltransferase involved in cell wall biosynthesis